MQKGKESKWLLHAVTGASETGQDPVPVIPEWYWPGGVVRAGMMGKEEVVGLCGRVARSNGPEKHECSSHELQLQRG